MGRFLQGVFSRRLGTCGGSLKVLYVRAGVAWFETGFALLTMTTVIDVPKPSSS